jgi:hypothetical protein
MSEGKKVYEGIVKASKLLAEKGIEKDKKNVQQNYVFRGIDDVHNAMSPALTEANLCIIPRLLSSETKEGKTGTGKPVFTVKVSVAYDIVSSEDGSMHTAVVGGEAMDMQDKATNKAMSMAYKYMAIQTFSIPTKGLDDADGQNIGLVSGMDESALCDWLAKIEQASTMDELKASYTTAYGVANTAKDSAAMSAILQAKNARKKALEANNGK